MDEFTSLVLASDYTIQRHGEAIHVLGRLGRKPVAGPFRTVLDARMWVIQAREAKLTLPQKQLWAQVMQRIGRPTWNLGLELGLIEMIAENRSEGLIWKCVPDGKPDRRMLQAGDAA